MPQARDEAGNIWEIDAAGNPVRLVQAAQSAPRPMTVGTADPAAQYAAPKAAMDLQGAQVRTQTDAAQLPYAAPRAAAEASKAQTDAEAAALRLQKERNEAGNVPDPNVAKALKSLGQDELLGAIRTAQGEISNWSTGVPGQVLKNWNGTQASDLRGSLNTIGSASMLAKLGELKAASPTGASGLGALSEREGAMLRDSISSIGAEQSAVKLRQSLSNVELHYRRAMAVADGQNPDDPSVAQQYGIAGAPQRRDAAIPGAASGGGMDRSAPPPTDGPQRGPQMGLSADGSYADKAGLTGANAHVAGMIKAGRPEAEIRGYLNGLQPGLGDAVGQLPEAIAYARQNPGKPIQVNVEKEWKPASGFSRAMGEAGMSPLGAGVIGAADMLTAGTLDNMTANPAQSRAVMEGVQSLNPNSYLIGQVAGGVGSGLGLEAGLGRAGLGLAGRMRAGDALLGGSYGAGSADESGDSRIAQALLGAGVGFAGGAAGRGASRTAGRLVAGVRDAPQRLLNERGVPQTIGQMLGGAAKTMEDRAAGFWGTGDLINPRRVEGIEGFNRAAFDEALAPIGANTGGQIGQAGVNASQDATGAAYDAALNGVIVGADGPFAADMLGTFRQADALPQDMRRNARDTLRMRVGDNFSYAAGNNGQILAAMTGNDFQQSVRGLRGDVRSMAQQPYGADFGDVAGRAETALEGMVSRQAPNVMPAYNAANEAYRNSSVIEDAVLAALNNPRGGGTFTPAQLGQASRANTKRFGGKRAAARGDMPFNELQQAGQAVLPSVIPDSGTAGRAAIPAVAAALAGGTGAASSEGGAGDRAGVGLGTGAVAAALVAAPYSAGGRNALQRALLSERPQELVRVGDYLINRSRIAGLLAAPAAVQYGQ